MKESVVFYKSYFEAIQNIPPEEQLKLYNAICQYSFTDSIPELEDGIAKAMFILIKPNIDSANARYTSSVENGKKGGRPPKETQTKPNDNPKETQTKPNDNLNDDVDEDDNDNDDVDVAVVDEDVKKITRCYEDNIGLITPATAETLFSYLEDFDDSRVICEAIKISARANKRNVNYINGILRSWKNKGYKLLADLQEEQRQDVTRDKNETEEEAIARKTKELEESLKDDW